MRVSVVIPLFNKARHIERAINSVLAQKHTDFELIVVDDGSTDGSGEVVGRITDPRVRLITQKNAGVSAARNRGVAEAATDMIAFLDADDEWKPNFLETIKRLSANHPECGAYALAYEIVEPSGKLYIPKFIGIQDPPWEGVLPNYFRSALGLPPISSSSSAVWRKCFDLLGGFIVNESFGEDLEMWCRIAIKYPIGYSNQIGATYHQDADNRACLADPTRYPYFLVETLDNAIASDQYSPWIKKDDLFKYRDKKIIESVSACILTKHRTKARQRLRDISSNRKMRGVGVFWCLLSYTPHSILEVVRKAINIGRAKIKKFIMTD